MQEPTGVGSVRQWRRQVAKEWEGKSWEQINEDLKRVLVEYRLTQIDKKLEQNSGIEDFR